MLTETTELTVTTETTEFTETTEPGTCEHDGTKAQRSSSWYCWCCGFVVLRSQNEENMFWVSNGKVHKRLIYGHSTTKSSCHSPLCLILYHTPPCPTLPHHAPPVNDCIVTTNDARIFSSVALYATQPQHACQALRSANCLGCNSGRYHKAHTLLR